MKKGGAEKLSGGGPVKNGVGEKPFGGYPLQKGGNASEKGGRLRKKGASPAGNGATNLTKGGYPAEKGGVPFFQSHSQKPTPRLQTNVSANEPLYCPLPSALCPGNTSLCSSR